MISNGTKRYSISLAIKEMQSNTIYLFGLEISKNYKTCQCQVAAKMKGNRHSSRAVTRGFVPSNSHVAATVILKTHKHPKTKRNSASRNMSTLTNICVHKVKLQECSHGFSWNSKNGGGRELLSPCMKRMNRGQKEWTYLSHGWTLELAFNKQRKVQKNYR